MPEAQPTRDGSTGRGWAPAVLVAFAALAAFAYDLPAEPHFVDESAYIAQSYFFDLYVGGSWDSPAWVEYPAYDLPPLPKYTIGLALHAAGYGLPGRGAARAWYPNTKYRPETDAMLWVARWPSVLLGVLGCLAIYRLGVLAGDRRVGVLAALLLLADPLYRMHARRAMSDVPAEALILATAAVALGAWRSTLAGRIGRAGWLATATGVGVLGGLAVLAKLNGGLALMIVAAWALLAVALGRFPVRRRAAVVGAALISGAVAFGTFVALNPFLTAHPVVPAASPFREIAAQGVWQRTRTLLDHRVHVSRLAEGRFPDDALRSRRDRVAAVAVQGFGRFGPFGPHASDSEVRYDWEQDWGALAWLPWVGLGAVWAAVRGRRQLRAGEPPTAWAVLLQAGVALVTVTAFIPLAWDRYFLSIQPGSALLAAGAAVWACDGLADLVRRRGGA